METEPSDAEPQPAREADEPLPVADPVELDLTHEEEQERSRPAAPGLVGLDELGPKGRAAPPKTLTEEPFSRRKARERWRGILATVLVVLFALVSAGLVTLKAVGAISIDDVKELAAVVLSPISALAGLAVGFYFGPEPHD